MAIGIGSTWNDDIPSERVYALRWNEFRQDDPSTYPREGADVIVSDGVNYDVAYYLWSSTYTWMKADLIKDDAFEFKAFEVKRWAFII